MFEQMSGSCVGLTNTRLKGSVQIVRTVVSDYITLHHAAST